MSDTTASPAAYDAGTAGNPGRNDAWPEAAQMALFGAGLSYVGLRLGKRKA